MAIDFTKFSTEFKKQWEKAIEDKTLTQEEISKFSKEDQKTLMEMLSGSPKEFEGISIEIARKQDDKESQSLRLYAGKNANEGLLDLTPDTLKQYPNAQMGYLKDGVVTLYDKSGRAVRNENGEPLRFVMNSNAEETKSSFASWYMEHNGGKFDIETLNAMQELDNRLNNAEASNEDMFSIMRDIDLAELKSASEDEKQGFFKQLDAKAEYKKQQAKAMLDDAKQMLYEAHENGTLGEKGEAFFNALMAACQTADSDIGLTKFKEFIKEISGINAAADGLTELADDGDDKNLSGLEETIELLKGAGRGLDSFIGTQGAAFIAALAAAGKAAAVAGVGEAFSLITHAYFAYEGASLGYEGVKEAVGAETKEQAGAAGEKLGMSAIMLAGTAKAGKHAIDVKLNAKYTKMEPEQLFKELEKENNKAERGAIYKSLREKGYIVHEQPIVEGGKVVGTEPRVYSPEGKLIEIEGSKAKAEVDALKEKYKNETDESLLAGWERTTPNSPQDKAISALLIERGYKFNKDGWDKIPTTVTNVTGRVTTENGGLTVTRPNGTQVDLFAGIPQEVLNAPAKNYMKFPDATTVPENFGVSLTQHASAPIEAQYIPTGKTVAETLELANKSGVPLKFDVQKQAFYQDAPYGGRQYVNTESITPIYTHEAEPNWGLAENYAQEYGHEVVTPDGPKTYAVDRAVVTANPNPTDNGLSANCAGKQYDIVYPDGTRKPYSPDLVKAGEPFQISKREGVELKMAVFDEPTTSAEGETLPAGKLMMIDADGHPYNGNPVKRLRSGEVEMQFDETDPVQAQMKQTLDKIKDLDTQTKAAKKAGNKDLANQHKAKADALAKELDTQLTEFVKAKQNPTAIKAGTSLGNEEIRATEPMLNFKGKTPAEIKTALQQYAKDNGLKLKEEKGFLDFPEYHLYDKSGAKVLKVDQDGSFATKYTYNKNGTKQYETTYMQGKAVDNIEYFYDKQGNTQYSTKTSVWYKEDGSAEIRSDLAKWSNGIGHRMGPGVSYTPAELKTKYGIDVNTSMLELPKTSAASEPAKTSNVSSPKTTVQVRQEDAQFAAKLAEYKDANGKQILSSDDITNLLQNQTGLGGNPIENFQAKVEAVLSNPEEVADISGWKNKSAGVWRAIQDPLSSTVDANPELFGAKPKAAPATQASDAQFAAKLAEYKDANGKQILSSDDITNLLQNQTGLGGNPIENFQAKVEAVLSNPEEVADISGWKNKSAGVWRAIQDPLNSTVDANPELFGAKPKAAPTSQNTQTPLIDNSRKPANLNPAVEQELNDYATQNNYELKYSKTGNAVFRNNDGKIVRRVDIDENGNLRNDRYFIARNGSTITGKKIASGTPIKNSLAKCKIPSKMQHTTGNIGNVTVNVALGDMTAIKADAFVVPEFQTCVSEGGVGGAIWSKGAGKGMEAYEKHIKKHGKQEFGSVVVTDAGGGNSSKLLHAVTVGSGAENEFTTIQTAVYNALRTAQEQGMQSVVIPQMGTGIIGALTSEQSAKAIMSGINQFNADGGKMDVSIVIYGSQNGYNTFTNNLQNHSYEDVKTDVGTKEFSR